MTIIDVVPVLAGDRAVAAWKLYYDAFEELDTLAVQRHLMYRSEFDEVMHDRRVDKYLAYGEVGNLLGVATFTNQLDAVPLISSAYFARRWPALYETGRIWYIGFMATSPAGRPGALLALASAMYGVAAVRGGVVGLDVCRHNGDGRGMGRTLEGLVRRHSPGVVVERADEQTYWLYEFPETGTTVGA